jgi:hypothetical protein
MNVRSPIFNRAISPRVEELLADRATQGLDDRELLELASSDSSGDPTFDLAVAAAMLAFEAEAKAGSHPLPASLRARIEADANTRFADPVLATIVPARNADRARRFSLGWAVAAMAMLAAMAAWWPKTPATSLSPSEQRQAMLQAGPGVGKWSWSDFAHPVTKEEPELKGVNGDVVWCEPQQSGFMRISGLKPNDPKVERYQLWIIDERGLEQRVSAGLFDVTGTGEIVVPFKPELKVKGAAVFAVTIEKPEGVVVSDLKRRACWALVSKS